MTFRLGSTRSHLDRARKATHELVGVVFFFSFIPKVGFLDLFFNPEKASEPHSDLTN